MLNKRWLIILSILGLGVFISNYINIPTSNSAPVVPIAIDDPTPPPDKNKITSDSKDDDNHKKPKECLKNLNKRQKDIVKELKKIKEILKDPKKMAHLNH
jgi:hypothetical protein